MRTILAFLLLTPALTFAAFTPPIEAHDEEITIVIVGDIAQVSGPNKIVIDVYDAGYTLVATETECAPITVYIDLSAFPDGVYHVWCTTTSGVVKRSVVKG